MTWRLFFWSEDHFPLWRHSRDPHKQEADPIRRLPRRLPKARAWPLTGNGVTTTDHLIHVQNAESIRRLPRRLPKARAWPLTGNGGTTTARYERRLLAPDQALNFTSVPSFLSMVRTSQTGATQSVLSPLVHWEAGLGFGSFGLPLSRLPARQATSLRPQEIRLVVPDLVHSFVPSVLSMVRTSQTGATQSVLSPLVHWEAGLGFRFFCFRLFCSPTRLNSTPVLTRPLSGSAETSRGAHQCSVPLIQTMDDRHHHWRTSSSMIFEFDIHSG